MKRLKNMWIKKATGFKVWTNYVMQEFFQDESGMGIVEIAIIILVIISLALLFQDKVEEFLNEIFQSFDTNQFS